MGVVATISRIGIDNFKEMKSRREYPPKYESGTVYLGKSWDILSYILVGVVGATRENILLEVINPKHKYLIAESDYSKEYLNYSPPKKVKEIHARLKDITAAAFKQLIEERDFNSYMMYAEILPKEKDQIFVGLKQNFLDLRQLFKEASESDNYMVTVIS
ncbi:MAG: DUF1877 family protein [Saprospiraceae bacterium]